MITGGNALRARMKSVSLVFKPQGKLWADKTAQKAKPRVPNKTGRLRASIKRKSATQKRATVVGHFTAYFVDAGPKPHTIEAKNKPQLVFKGARGTVFARKVHHRGYAGRPFRARSANEALAETWDQKAIVDAWNKGA